MKQYDNNMAIKSQQANALVSGHPHSFSVVLRTSSCGCSCHSSLRVSVTRCHFISQSLFDGHVHVTVGLVRSKIRAATMTTSGPTDVSSSSPLLCDSLSSVTSITSTTIIRNDQMASLPSPSLPLAGVADRSIPRILVQPPSWGLPSSCASCIEVMVFLPSSLAPSLRPLSVPISFEYHYHAKCYRLVSLLLIG
jgi:hypothetical protein